MKSSRQLALIAALFLQLLPAFADDVITNVMSPIASYQYPNDFSSESLTNGGVISPFVSFEYLENFSSAALTNGGIMSPIVSYQYYEWPGDGILNLQSSPVVSYYWQFGNSSGPTVLHGRVTDANGTPLSGATVAAMIYLSPVAQANTDANGNYQMPSLDAGVYDLSAWDATHQTSMRALTLNANTAEQNFQLKPMPLTPAMQQANRQSSLSYSVDAKGSRLLFFNGTVFTNIDANNAPSPNLMTIVLTHGWVPGTPDPSIMNTPFDRWPTNMAAQLWAAGINTGIANIVAWDWRYAAMDPFPPSDAVDLTPDQGVALGEALTNALGTGYSQPIHFIGHSLGTIVNAAAANFLHGDPNGNARRPVSFSPWNSSMHITLFDQARVAEIGGRQVLDDGLDPSALDAFNAAFGNSPPQNWQSPLPNNYFWADSYDSLVGQTLPGAVNIWLQKSPYSPSDLLDIHSYPIDWYGMSISNPTDSKNPLGFQNSYEFDGKNGLSFAAPSMFQQGSIYHQVPTDSDPLALEPVTGVSQNLGLLPDYVLTGAENLWQGTVLVAGQVLVNVEDAAQRTAQSVSQNFNYVTGVAAQGGQTVMNFLGSAVLQFTLTTAPPTTPSPQVRSNLPQPLGLSGNSASNTPAMVWLPLQIPTDAAAMAFDFTVSGDPVDDSLVCGIGTTNLFSLQAKYIPTNTVSASRLIDVTAWAGTTNELFFGFLGGTSTNATLQIDNIRFYSLQPPALQAQISSGNFMLAWPLSAQNFSLQTTTNLADPNSWMTVPDVPAIVNLQFLVTNQISDGARFYRLKQ